MSLPDSQDIELDLFDDNDIEVLELAASNCKLSDEFNMESESQFEDTLSRLVRGTITGGSDKTKGSSSSSCDDGAVGGDNGNGLDGSSGENGSNGVNDGNGMDDGIGDNEGVQDDCPSLDDGNKVKDPGSKEEFYSDLIESESPDLNESGVFCEPVESSSKSSNAAGVTFARKSNPVRTSSPRPTQNGKGKGGGNKKKGKKLEKSPVVEKIVHGCKRDRLFQDPIKTSVAAKITSAIEMAGEVNDGSSSGITKNGESGFVAHDFSMVASDVHEYEKTSPSPTFELSFVSVVELTRNGVMRTIPNDDSLPFVLVSRKGEGWTSPPLHLFHAVINMLEGFIMDNRPYLKEVVSWSKEWKGVGVVGLNSANLDYLEEWRGMVVQMVFPGFELDTFPKDCLLVGSELTILLKDRHRSYDLKYLPFSLFSRNKGLYGKVRVTHSKTYTSSDTTWQGISKKGWRLVYLAGDTIFMDSLKAFPSNFGFKIGSSKVQMWGGVRKPMLPFSITARKSRFSWRRADSVAASLLDSLSPEDVDREGAKEIVGAVKDCQGSKTVKAKKIGQLKESSKSTKFSGKPMNRRTRLAAKKTKEAGRKDSKVSE